MGSSPRGRGKPRTHGAHARADGLIPARAGKTHGLVTKASSKPAHPRAGGENPGAWWLPVVAGGSSPRGRGKLANAVPGASGKRLIPARAGKTLWPPSASSPSRAHPRAGGENKPSGALANIAYGSSPRGRGKRDHGRTAHRRAGLIPARAGKTMCCTRYAEDRGAHPRAGGESSLRPITILSPAGSSPLGRGKPSETPLTPRSVRLIPARAGKTGREYRRSPGRRAHPRAGGENPCCSR